MCPDWLQEQLLSWMIESAERGRPGFRDMLTMTPCDLFSLIRGRTLWLMGDSMMQVLLLARLRCQTSIASAMMPSLFTQPGSLLCLMQLLRASTWSSPCCVFPKAEEKMLAVML